MEASSSSTCSTEQSNFKKVVWPNINHDHVNKNAKDQQSHHHHNNIFLANQEASNGNVDKPMAWVKNAAHSTDHPHSVAETMEMEIQKRTWDATNGRRLSRSRSKHIMERARSFERAAADIAAGSNPPSRQGSLSNISGQVRGRRRSPSVGRSQLAEQWMHNRAEESGSRPSSRAAREKSVGRIDTTRWEAAMAAASEGQAPPPKTPPVKRKQLIAPSPAPRPDTDDHQQFPSRIVNGSPTSGAVWPSTRTQHHEQQQHTLPPPRNYGSKVQDLPQPPPSGELNASAVQQLSREDKDHIVEQWVRQTSTQQAQDELEQFAFEIAESVVSTMERNNNALSVKVSNSLLNYT